MASNMGGASYAPESTLPLGNLTLYSAQQLQVTWNLYQIKDPMPAVNFSSKMVVFARAQTPGAGIEIVDVRLETSRVLVLYRETVPAGEGQSPILYSYRVIALSNLPVVFKSQP